MKLKIPARGNQRYGRTLLTGVADGLIVLTVSADSWNQNDGTARMTVSETRQLGEELLALANVMGDNDV